jgi:hypothetical protein
MWLQDDSHKQACPVHFNAPDKHLCYVLSLRSNDSVVFDVGVRVEAETLIAALFSNHR